MNGVRDHLLKKVYMYPVTCMAVGIGTPALTIKLSTQIIKA